MVEPEAKPTPILSLYPDLSRHPYYIHAPHYAQTSAGIRCLHLLCHWLNRMGERAFMIITSDHPRPVNDDLLCPLLTLEISTLHFAQGKTPVVIYPEVVGGNPLQAKCVVRYLLNYPGHLGGDAQFDETEMVVAFSRVLAQSYIKTALVLHMPVLDTHLFQPGNPGARSGSVYYAMKYQHIHQQKVFSIPADSIEITGTGLLSRMSPVALATVIEPKLGFVSATPTVSVGSNRVSAGRQRDVQYRP